MEHIFTDDCPCKPFVRLTTDMKYGVVRHNTDVGLGERGVAHALASSDEPVGKTKPPQPRIGFSTDI